MIRAIIIDDEKHCIDRLTRILEEEFATSLKVLAASQSVEDGLQAITKYQPDLIFLDVQLHDKTGFDLLKQLQKPDFEIIFTTAYEKYAVQAFKFSAIDYLLKPVDTDDIKQAMEKVLKRISGKRDFLKVDALLQNLSYLRNESKRICVPVMNGLEFIQVGDIIRCESEINYTTIFIKDKPRLVVAKTLKEFEELLKDYNFFRVHNSHLVNIAWIKSYQKGKGGTLTMLDNSVVEVSTRKKDDLLNRLTHI